MTPELIVELAQQAKYAKKYAEKVDAEVVAAMERRRNADTAHRVAHRAYRDAIEAFVEEQT